MSLNRTLLIAGAAIVIAAWPNIPDIYRVEWPLTTFVVVAFVVLLPVRVLARFKTSDQAPVDEPRDWRAHWALPILALPFALMIDASTSQGAVSYGHWAFGLVVAAFLVWYAKPAFNSHTR
jgi:hypothetical protein